MTPELQRLIDSLSSDSDDHTRLRRELSQTTDIMEACEIINRNGYSISEYDLKTYISAQQADSGVSDSQLDSVSGAGIRPNDGCFGFDPRFFR